jgi:hypothetical protein
MKKFKNGNETYKFNQSVNGCEQWRCDYKDGEYALAMVYAKKVTKTDVIEAIDRVNEEKSNN